MPILLLVPKSTINEEEYKELQEEWIDVTWTGLIK
jgi:hypothetical protein